MNLAILEWLYGPMSFAIWVNTAIYCPFLFFSSGKLSPQMSPHVLLCLAAVLFAGMVQVKASDYNDCPNQLTMNELFGSPIDPECQDDAPAPPAEPIGPIGPFDDFSDILSNLQFEFKKKK